MLSFDPEIDGGQPRPNFFVPKYNLLYKLDHVIQNCPAQLKVKWGERNLESLESISKFFKEELGQNI